MLKISQVAGAGSAASHAAGSGANQILQLDSEGKLPQIDGSNLTGISSGGGSSSASLLPIVNAPISSSFVFIPSTLGNSTVYYIDSSSSTQSSITYTLPSASAVGEGFMLHLTRTAGGTSIAIQRTGSDTIMTTQLNRTIASNDSYTLVSDGVSNWAYVGQGLS
jgi:hypothetical protein